MHLISEPMRRESLPPFSETRESLNALCAGAGWPCLERAPGHWRVEMEGTPGFCQAEITALEGDLHLCVVLAEWEELPSPCAEAVTHLFLTASDTFRGIRPTLEIQGQKRRALLRACLAVADLETEFLHALCALSVGAERMLQEVGALQDPGIAASYLAMTSSLLEEKRRNDDERKHP